MPIDRAAMLAQLRRREVSLILRAIRVQDGDPARIRYYAMQAQECRIRIEYIEKGGE